MIHFFEVGKFMNHDVIYDFIRRQQKSPVEVKVMFGAAASPSRFLFSDGDAVVRDTHNVAVMRRFSVENLMRLQINRIFLSAIL